MHCPTEAPSRTAWPLDRGRAPCLRQALAADADPDFERLAAELRNLTQGRKQSHFELLLRERATRGVDALPLACGRAAAQIAMIAGAIMNSIRVTPRGMASVRIHLDMCRLS